MTHLGLTYAHPRRVGVAPVLALLSLAVALVSPANAALLSRDLFVPGDGLLTLDATSGLEWVDAAYLSQFSYRQFLDGETPLNGLGFSLPTDEQMGALLVNAGADLICPGFMPVVLPGLCARDNSGNTMFFGSPTSRGNYDALMALSGLGVIGTSTPSGNGVVVYGFTSFYPDSGFNPSWLLVAYTEVSPVFPLTGYIDWQAPVLTSYPEWPVGSLARGAVVPVPAAAWLFASALGGLAWLRRKV
jgi:hypothetical protein